MSLINTDVLKAWIENWFVKNSYYHPYSKSNNIPIPELYDILERIPAIDAEPVRHGHWVHGKELSRDYIGDVCVSVHYDKWWCSECYYPAKEQPLWNYCPKCGAKMDEQAEDDAD